MDMDIGVSFQYPMSIGTGVSVIFENGYRYKYSSTRPECAPLPSLAKTPTYSLYFGNWKGVRKRDRYYKRESQAH